jgi:glycosyltransferase involved in cell wall biosynthesis
LFLELAADLPQYHFLWVGGRPNDVEQWRNKLRESGLENVTFAGFISNKILPQYQAAAEILLMPYRKDMRASSGQNPEKYFNPMKMFDYMAAGRPIITSTLPVIREVLDEEKAVFCPPEDVAAWSKAITQLMKDSEKRELLGQHAREEVTQYTWVERAKKGFQDFI